MDTMQLCPSCGRPLPPAAPKGLCPECLLKAALQTEALPNAGDAAKPKPPPFVPPTPEELAKHFPQLGMALDGDGDRVVMVDELGRCVDGDQLLYILATALRQTGELRGPVVGTVMSNLGLEHALAERNIEFRRAQ